MYYFENLNIDFAGGSGACGADFGGCGIGHAKEAAKGEFFEILKIGAKFRRQLFDDYSFCLGAKSKLEGDFECALRMIEVIREAGDMFFVVRKGFEGNECASEGFKKERLKGANGAGFDGIEEAGKTNGTGITKCGIDERKTGDIAGFWYIYDVNYARSFGEDGAGIVKTPVVGTIAGCLKKEFWGCRAREIMHKVLKKAFFEFGFQKIKSETFSTNPYIEGFLKEFNFRCEGVLIGETMASGRAADVKIWGLLKDEYEV